jgi:hypothetical protein
MGFRFYEKLKEQYFRYDNDMKIQTKYNYEKVWTLTNETDLIKIIIEEIGDADPQGTLLYLKEALKRGTIVNIGSCGFKKAT